MQGLVLHVVKESMVQGGKERMLGFGKREERKRLRMHGKSDREQPAKTRPREVGLSHRLSAAASPEGRRRGHGCSFKSDHYRALSSHPLLLRFDSLISNKRCQHDKRNRGHFGDSLFVEITTSSHALKAPPY
jgi:hypothetical protein